MRWNLFFILLLIFNQGYAMKLTSTAFEHNGWIPVKYSCKGEDISPPLEWQDVPKETKSFVLILSDPDAPMGTWDHWIVINLNSSQTSLPENTTSHTISLEMLPNSWGKNNYGGPCPPSGTHHYIFDLYALDTKLTLSQNTDKKTLLKTIKPHIIETAQLVGLFQKI
jgi:Raf kinase inhibitor-like YbhB/YbcL family protein